LPLRRWLHERRRRLLLDLCSVGLPRYVTLIVIAAGAHTGFDLLPFLVAQFLALARGGRRRALRCAHNPAALAELLDRRRGAITQRLRRVGLREHAGRSPHHPVPSRGWLTPVVPAAMTRELHIGRTGLRTGAGTSARPVARRRPTVGPAAAPGRSRRWACAGRSPVGGL
jgi:hypothetical protein